LSYFLWNEAFLCLQVVNKITFVVSLFNCHDEITKTELVYHTSAGEERCHLIRVIHYITILSEKCLALELLL